jgi:DNA-binding NarL/FixJ family response regulator
LIFLALPGMSKPAAKPKRPAKKSPFVEVVAEAGDASEALRLIEKVRPDVVLLDVTMPGISGFDALKQISTSFPEVRVIVLTMHEAREYAIQALRAGAAGFIPKSAAAADLKQAIETVMQGKTYVSTEAAQRAALTQTDETQAPLQKLTARQRQILVMIAEGQSTKQIARNLNISVKTVETHRAQLSERLNIHDVAGLVRFAIRMGLVKVAIAIIQVLIAGLIYQPRFHLLSSHSTRSGSFTSGDRLPQKHPHGSPTKPLLTQASINTRPRPQ